MKQEYRLGQHWFETEEEYQTAVKDYEYTKRYMEELDLRQPAMAKRLYEKLEQSSHLMKSKVGEGFKEKLVEIYVRDVVQQEKRKVEATQKLTLRYYLKTLGEDGWMRMYRDLFLVASGVQLLYYLVSAILVTKLRLTKYKIGRMLLFGWTSYSMCGTYVASVLMLLSVLLMVRTLIQRIRQKSGTKRWMGFLLGTGLCSGLYLVTFPVIIQYVTR